MAGVNYAVPFVNGVKITTTQSVLFTAPSSLFSVVFGTSRLVHFQETTPVVTTIDLWLVQPGDDETNAKFKIVSQKAMGVNQTHVLNELIGSALLAGGEVWGQASVNDMVAFTASGTERLA